MEHYRSEILHLDTLIIPISIPRPFLVLLVFFVLFVLLFVSLTALAVSSTADILDGVDVGVASQGLCGFVLQGWQHALHGCSLLHLLLPLLPFLLLPLPSSLFRLLALLLFLREAMLPVLLVLLGGLRVHILLLLLTSLFLGLLALFLLEVLLLVRLICVLHSLLPSIGHLLEQRFLLLLGLLLAFLGDDIVLTEVIFILGFCGKFFFLGLSRRFC